MPESIVTLLEVLENPLLFLSVMHILYGSRNGLCFCCALNTMNKTQIRSLIEFSHTRSIYVNNVKLRDEEQDPSSEYKNDICFVLANIDGKLVPCILCGSCIFYENNQKIHIERYDEFEWECIYYEFLKYKHNPKTIDPLRLICIMCRNWYLYNAISMKNHENFNLTTFIMLKLLSEWSGFAFSYEICVCFTLNRPLQMFLVTKEIFDQNRLNDPRFDRYKNEDWFKQLTDELELDIADSVVCLDVKIDEYENFSRFIIDYFEDMEITDATMDQLRMLQILMEYFSGEESEIRNITKSHRIKNLHLEYNVCNDARNMFDTHPDDEELRYFNQIIRTLKKNAEKQK